MDITKNRRKSGDRRANWGVLSERDRLKAENAKLRAALKAAPPPTTFIEPSTWYQEWFTITRAEPLKGGSHE